MAVQGRLRSCSSALWAQKGLLQSDLQPTGRDAPHRWATIVWDDTDAPIIGHLWLLLWVSGLLQCGQRPDACAGHSSHDAPLGGAALGGAALGGATLWLRSMHVARSMHAAPLKGAALGCRPALGGQIAGGSSICR